MANSTIVSGVPTQPDVKRIRDNYPDELLHHGQVISYKEIERILNVRKAEPRFRTVTNKWRRDVEKATGKVIGTRPGVGFVVLNNHQKVDLSFSKLRQATRSARRSYELTGNVNIRDISHDQRQRLHIVQKHAAGVISAANTAPTAKLPELEDN